MYLPIRMICFYFFQRGGAHFRSNKLYGIFGVSFEILGGNYHMRGAGVNLCLEKVIQFIRIVGYRLPQSPSLLFPFPPSFSFLFLPLFSSPLGIPYFSHLWVFPSNFSPFDSRLSPFPFLFPLKVHPPLSPPLWTPSFRVTAGSRRRQSCRDCRPERRKPALMGAERPYRASCPY